MFCKNCGNEILENQVFCTKCGAEVEEAVEEANALPEAEVIAETEDVPEMETVESFNVIASDEGEISEPTLPAKKKKTGLIIGLASAAVVVVLAVLAAFNFNFVKGYAVKTFGSDTDYLRFVEEQSVSKSVNAITEAYAVVIEEKEESSKTVKLQPKLSQSAQELIGENLAGETDLDWINELSLSATGELDGDKAAANLALALSNSDILKFDAIVDAKEQVFYFALSNLNDKFIKEDITLDDAIEGGDGELAKIMEALDDPEFKKALPSEKALNELLTKYADIIINKLEAVGTSTKYLTVGELTGEFTVIEYEITEEDALAIAEEILKTAKEDAELKEIIESVCGYLAEKEIIDPDIDYYDEFKEIIEEGLDSIEEAMDKADDDEPIILKTFVNSKHEVCGRTVEIDGEEIITNITVQKGTKFAIEAENEEFKIEGSGEVKGGKLIGEYTVRVDGKAYLDLIIEDADLGKLKDNKFDGTIRIEFSDTLIEEMVDSDFTDLMEEYDFTLELKAEVEDKSSKHEINILSKGELFVGFDITTAIAQSDGEITVPTEAIDSTDYEALTKWAESLDTDKVLDMLRDKGVDEEIVSIAESFLVSFKSSLDFDASDDYYGESLDDMYGGSMDDVYGDTENVFVY